MLVNTPPMGWNSWNTFGPDISETLLKETADSFIEYGLLDAGYNYIVIDDCWSKRQRENNRLVADENKFPNGIKALADYIHEKGMKFGIYSCAGTRTCGVYPGSFEYEFIDADTFASWGVDFLKYDFCFKPETSDGPLLYKRMAMALRSVKRDILFSACNWGADKAETWMRSAGANMWRSTGDIQDNWESIKKLAYQQFDKHCYGATGCFNDIDMLVCGMYGKGNAALGGCTDDEYKTHFSFWCLFNSPLMIGCDVRNMSDATKNILTNKDIIAINQDPECRQPYVASNWDNNRLVFVRPLADYKYALGYFNFSDSCNSVYLNFWDIGLPVSSGYGLKLYDVWQHETIGVFKEFYSPVLEPHCCAVYTAELVNL